ncbi:response regulator transcription factor [Pelodictyon luteolum]|uniref:Two component transcriptional regulator, winged helix family n=1 Tax=Chlorobium luteolum (strain DSM 273 / BCRC 81028 / 2530) TaxID=319225 RepID=Q3B6N3_CHLL3|nr:winged helix-turn-helix domain-containing protein [Pelodictyon luteolum]ABB22998.1 two component transcriptional regulator, winged helix family [Pelodictyon luteolum DSM 273]
MSNSSRIEQPACQRIVVVVSDPDCRSRLAAKLRGDGHDVDIAGSALEFYGLLAQREFRLAVLEAELSDQNGLVVARFLRRNTPISSIMLAGSVDRKVRLAVYHAGSLACFCKPVDLGEFSVLVDNLLNQGQRTSAGAQRTTLEIPQGHAKWKILRNGWVLAGPRGTMVKLTINEFEFMSLLASSNQMAVSRKAILEHMGYRNDVHGNKALEAVVHRLRLKTQVAGGSLIETAHGVGWGFSSEVALV